MMIQKNIYFGEVLLNPSEGKIWINAPNCILRIQGINFKRIREKFSMIDINGSNGVMVEGDLIETDFDKFMENMTNICLSSNFSEKEFKELLETANKIRG